MLDVAAAEVGVVVGDRGDDVVQREVEAAERFWVDDRRVLLGFAAPGVDLADAGNGEQLVADDPVVQRLELHQRHLRRGDRVLVDFAEGRGHGVHLRLQAGRDAALHLVDALRDQLADKIFVHGVVEDDGNHGQVELGGGAHHLQLGHAHHGGFDRIGDELLDLDRRHAGALHRDDDLIVGEVGEGFEGQLGHDVDAADDEAQQQRGDKPAIVEEEVNQSSSSLARLPRCL